MSKILQIPSLDLNDFKSSNLEKKENFVKNLGEAYQDIGFIALKNYGLNTDIETELYQEVRNFFNLPTELKQKYEKLELNGQRGYISFGKETAKGFKKSDLKEFWHFGQELENKPHLKSLYPENIKVQELTSFNSIGIKVFKSLERTAQILLQAIALYLNLETTYFDKFILEGNSILRAIHYPPITKQPKEAERAAAHGDINLITLLMGAQGYGLQVLNRQNQWIDAVAEPNELIINVGDMLSRLTNNRLASTIHRVVNPPEKDWGKARYSIPFFMHPVPKMPLNCLPESIDENNPKKFDDITAGEFLNERLIALGLLKD